MTGNEAVMEGRDLALDDEVLEQVKPVNYRGLPGWMMVFRVVIAK